jgi:mono/diheme cytochrome c family protein/small nuclear ribonucleoprotein (snRNP)-like protein
MQQQIPRPAPPAGGGGGPRTAYPERTPADPAVVARGKALYGVNCTFCHGSEARGGEGGPNLIRSQLVLNDQAGELITPVVQNGRPDRGMPKMDLTAAQVGDVAAFIHSFKVGGYDISRQKPISIVVGDAKAGEAFFAAKCASCHSPAGDLKGFGAKFSDPRAMQQAWLVPARGGSGRGGRGGGESEPTLNVPPTTVTVTLPSGEKVEGRLGRVDDFIVTLTDATGMPRTFRRQGDVPKVEVHDPVQPHRELLRIYTDKNIHDVTAFLVTLK